MSKNNVEITVHKENNDEVKVFLEEPKDLDTKKEASINQKIKPDNEEKADAYMYLLESCLSSQLKSRIRFII